MRGGPVLHLVAGARHGGAETFTTDLFVALGEAGLDQVVVTRPWPERLARLRAAGVRAIPATLPFALPPALGRLALAPILRRERPSAVVAYMGRAAAIAPRGAVGWFGGYYDLRRYARCGHLVAITPHMRDDMIGRGADPARLSLIPTFAALEDSPPAPRAALGVPEDAPLILCLARLHPKKGLDTLLDALALIPDAHLLIAGEGEERGALEARIASLGLAPRARLLGWRDDRGALLRAADVLAVPSRYEPFGTVVIEGWAAGIPVVAAAAAGPAATITHGGDGLLVPVDDAPALAAALSDILSDLRSFPTRIARLTATAARRLRERYSREAVVASYLDLFARLGRR